MNIFQKRYFYVSSYSSKEVLKFIQGMVYVSDSAKRILKALQEKHDSEVYAIRLMEEIESKILNLIEHEPVKKNIVFTLDQIGNEEYNKQIAAITSLYVPDSLSKKFSKDKNVKNAIYYTYNYTELKVINRLSENALKNIDRSLIAKLEPLRRFEEISKPVNCLQYLIDKLYKMQDRINSKLSEDKKYLDKRHRITKCIILKNFRKSVSQMKKNIYCSNS